MEGEDIAPVGRGLEHVDHTAERILEDPVDIRMHSVVSLNRLQKERNAEAASRQAVLVSEIGAEQDIFVLPRLFDSGSGASRKEQRRDEEDESQTGFDRIPLIRLIHCTVMAPLLLKSQPATITRATTSE